MIKPSILLVEDDSNLGFVIQDNLVDHGYEVTWAKDGKEALSSFNGQRFDICLLDVMLPKKDGFQLAKDIRSKDSNTPLLFITARGMQEDRNLGFELGGDDYLVKPFSIKELIFRIEVFLKRSNSNPNSHNSVTKIGNMVFTYSELKLEIAGNEKTLTQREADLLKLFFDNQNVILKREEILKNIWGDDDYFMGRSLDVFISKIRKYLKPATEVEIQNYHGVGFKLAVNS